MPELKMNMNIDGDSSHIKGTELSGGSTGSPCRIDVKDGRLMRIDPLHYDWKYDPSTFNPWVIKARGKEFRPNMRSLPSPFGLSYKKRVYSPNRVLWPLKRVDWDPDGDRNTQNRGKSGYERISWDEATDIIAKEFLRLREQYGPESIYCQTDMHGEGKMVNCVHGAPNKLLSLLGGYTVQMRNMDSWEGWAWGAKHVWGMEMMGEQEPQDNVVPDVAKNSEMILFWGCDPEVTPLGMNGMLPSRLCYWFSELGIKCIFICPDLNYGAGVHADKWIPIKPGTDAALQLAIAYTWITEGTYDKEYVATHVVGFEEFSEYVLGHEDGIPKTPEWAEPKCGVPQHVTLALAHEWAKKRTTIAHGNGGGGIRSAYATENARLEVILLGMQGLGKPGVHQMKMLEWNGSMPNTARGFMSARFSDEVRPAQNSKAEMGMMMGPNAFGEPSEADLKLRRISKQAPVQPQQFIPKNLLHDAILRPPIKWYGNSTFLGPSSDQFNEYMYPAPGCSEIHAMWTDSPCWITCWNDSNDYIKAVQSSKIEFFLAQHPWMENDCLLADIILPVNTKYEENDMGGDSGNGLFTTAYAEQKCIDSLGESVSDWEAVCKIAEKLGLLEEYANDTFVDERVRLVFESNKDKIGMEWEEFQDKQYYVFPTPSGWEDRPAGLYKFYKDPEHNPLRTESGKLEFTSGRLSRYFPDDEERAPYPKWVEQGEDHDERLGGERSKKYPLLLVSNHGRWRMHAQNDDNAWCREAPTCKVIGRDGYAYEPCWINTQEAEKRGIKHGDIVRVYNERGSVLAGAYVTERLNTDCAYMDHGARYDPIIPGVLDRGGSINTITPHARTSKNVTGMVVSSFLVEVERVSDEQLEEWRKINPTAFGKRYDKAAGICLDSFLEASRKEDLAK